MAKAYDAGGPAMFITVAHCVAPGQVREVRLELPSGSTVDSALRACGVAESATQLHQGLVGIWGKVCAIGQPLKDGDRVEIYRPLLVDPKVARRERFARQGSRSAGLFARGRQP